MTRDIIIPIDLSEDRDAWERQPRETPRAWAAFCIYRDQGVWNRSMRGVAKELGRNASRTAEWAKRYRWTTRVEAYDAHMEREKRVAQEEAIIDMADRHARLAAVALNKIAQRLIGDEVAGVKAIDVNALGPQDLARLMEVSVKVERLARGAETERVALDAEEGIKLKVAFNVEPQYPEEREGGVALPPGKMRELEAGESVIEGTARADDPLPTPAEPDTIT